jgi:acetylornithine deacetylase
VTGAAADRGSEIAGIEQRVIDAIDVDGMLAFLAELIAIPSVANAETPAQELVASHLTALGLRTDVWEIDFDELKAHHGYTSDVERSEGLGVVGMLEGSGGGRTLVLNGHIDVVPAGEPDRWTYPPFELTRVGDRLFGRGVVDMKGQVCCAIYAAKAIRAAGIDLGGDLHIQSVIGEEDGGAGALATILRGHTGDGAIVVEPTDFVVAPAQAGALSFRLTVPGKAAHGALREEGVDPVEKFLPIFEALRRFETERNTDVEDPLFAGDALPFAITMGRLEAGIWPSTVAESLTVSGRYGVAPGEDLSAARSAFENVVSAAARRDGWLGVHPPVVEWVGAQFESARTDEMDPVVRVLTDAAGALLGRPARVGGVRFGADMRLLTNHGGVPTVIFGPGDVREAHRPDESVGVQDLVRAAEILAVTAVRFCGLA